MDALPPCPTAKPRTSSRSGCASWRGWKRSRSSRSSSTLREEAGKKLDEILGSPATLRRLMIKEIEADAKIFGDDRRTLIQPEKKAVLEVQRGRRAGHGRCQHQGLGKRVRDRAGNGATAGCAVLHLQGRRHACTAPSSAARSTRCWPSATRVASIRCAVSMLPGARGDGQPVTTLARSRVRHPACRITSPGRRRPRLLLSQLRRLRIPGVGREHGVAAEGRQGLCQPAATAKP
jgi:hypothetical protein